MDWSFFLKSLLLGLVQGLTEFLPVSSSGHLVIAEHLLGIKEPGVVMEVSLHLGTLIAVFIYFRREIFSLIRSLLIWLGSLMGRRPNFNEIEYTKWRRDLAVVLGIILGSIPTGIIGVLGKKRFEELFDRVDAVGAFLIVTAALLTLGDWAAQKAAKSGIEGDTAPSWWKSVLIGVFQGVAIAPGISRSGATVSGGLILGLEPVSAARFSFLLGIPAILGAAVLSAKDIEYVPASELAGYVGGALVALAAGCLGIAVLIGTLRRGKLRWFALYCFIVGFVTLLLSLK